IGDISSSLQFAENGDLIFLASGTEERVAQTPDVPTFAELGAELDLLITRGIVMPKGAPEEAQATLEAALEQLSQDETFIQQINNSGADVLFRGREDYFAYLDTLSATVERLSEVIAP
ncbi:tripartite tricarboxylate transporter substrate-binding protein, partial [Roseinatronobacter sp.]|uniref:tripartite tricarboxylate transporter substrate-binding protein n=1 Tax=Roseinatronobacter sp. TaxID=1945755 RepID=UPI0025F5CBF6